MARLLSSDRLQHDGQRGIIFIKFKLPETKGQTLEHIKKELVR
jgi:hypothetical protein